MATPFNPNEPIPNDPFFYERTAAISGPLGPIEVGSGLEVTPTGEMIAVGGGPAVTYLTAGPGIYVNANTGTVRIVNTGVLNLAAGNGIGLVRDTNNGTWTITNTAPAVNLGGTVTQVNTGDGLVGGPITTSGTIALSNTGVSAGTYQNATVTVDAKGRVTAASPGSAISTISGTSPIVVTPGANATVSINEGSSTAIGALRVCDAINVSCSTIAASSSAVKSAYDIAAAALPCSVLAAQGDLISAAAAGIPVRVPAGADGSFLKVCTACAGTGGLTWDSLTFCEGTVTSVSAGNGLTGGTITTSGTIALDTTCVISPTLFTSQGALLTATGPDAPTALGVGSNGQLLSANNLCSEGLEWVTPTPSVPCSAFNVKGDILVATGPASYAALPVGANGTLLLACSACTEGVTWVAPEPVIPSACITGKGALITGSVPGIPSTLPVGANGYVLSANSSCLLGLEWVANSQGDVTSVQANAPLTVDNTDPQNPVLSVDAASLTAAGVVQLNNTVSSTSTTQAATANAVKGAYDEGVNANLAALAAQTSANAAQADATQALSDAATAQGTANQAVIDAAAAQSDATQALSDSAVAQGTADQAVLDAAAAQADATQALSDAAGAQSTANQAVINAAAAQGDATQALTNAAAAQTTANQAVVDAGAAQSDATQALSNAATAQSSANQALLDASAAQDAADLAGLDAQAAQADATQALTDAATAQATASAALPLSGGVMTGTVTFASGQTIPANAVQSASTSQAGIVQLNDTVSSTSLTQALTANQGKNLQDQINALAVGSNLTLAGTLDASTGNLVTVTTEGSATGFAIGSPLPSAAAGNDNFFVIATVASFSYTPPGGVSTQVHVGDWFLSNGSVWEFLDVGFQAPYASTTVAGIVELATDLETQDGQDANVVVSPYALQSKLSDSTSTTSSTTIASSTAVKAAYDAGIQGQTDAASAQSSANQALLDAAGAQTSANNAQSTANQAVLDAAAAQSDANQALLDAASAQTAANSAQSTADQGVLDAAAAQADANQALLDAASAQTSAGNAQSTANQAVLDAAAAQGDANQALLDAASAQTAANNAQSTANQGVTDAAAAQSTADQAILDAAAATGAADDAIPCAAFTSKGEILSGTGAGSFSALPLGSNGQVLTVDSLCSTGLKWAAAGGGGSGTVTDVTAGAGLTGGTITTTGTIALDTTAVIQPSALTAKGDIITATASSTPTALGVGTDGQVLSACSACASGLYWATPQTSPFVTYTSAPLTYTNGTSILVAVWGGGTLQGTVSLDMVGYGGFQSYWDFYLTGDATNGPSGWVQTNYFPPTTDGRSQGTWGVDYPVYPSPNNGLWEIYFNPTADALNPSSFTFFYRILGGGNPSWQI